jgi:GH35 family endo-1,4-beta-xylanase
MKGWVLRPNAGTLDFREGDEVVRFALEHGMKVRGHCLGWDHNHPQSQVIYGMVNDFKRRGVPIDAVGGQLHLSPLDLDTAAIAANIARLTAFWVQIRITELDLFSTLGPRWRRSQRRTSSPPGPDPTGTETRHAAPPLGRA